LTSKAKARMREVSGTMADHSQSSEPESSDSLKGFGEVVKGFREHAGVSREELAPAVCCSKHTIASIELGRRFPPPHFAEQADEALGAFGIIKRAAKHLSRNPGLAAWFRMWARMEQDAANLGMYECLAIPGLLQTEEYVRAMFRSRVPPLSDEEVETRIAARLARQCLLREKPNTAFSFIIEEALLLRRTGGAEVTRGLIDHLLTCAALRNVEFQIMPLEQVDHAGTEGPIRLLETPENQWFGYSEGQRSGHFFTDPKEVSVLQMRYARLRTQALTPEASVSLLERMRGAI
jgi:transcriptional regulator with XRE-family HTH domain